jgi:hypothetical protein
LWRWKYRFGGKEKRLSFGSDPDVSLKAARDRRDAARRLLAAGTDPWEAREARKAAQAGAESFEAIAREWHASFASTWVASHGDRIMRCPVRYSTRAVRLRAQHCTLALALKSRLTEDSDETGRQFQW